VTWKHSSMAANYVDLYS